MRRKTSILNKKIYVGCNFFQSSRKKDLNFSWKKPAFPCNHESYPVEGLCSSEKKYFIKTFSSKNSLNHFIYTNTVAPSII